MNYFLLPVNFANTIKVITILKVFSMRKRSTFKYYIGIGTANSQLNLSNRLRVEIFADMIDCAVQQPLAIFNPNCVVWHFPLSSSEMSALPLIENLFTLENKFPELLYANDSDKDLDLEQISDVSYENVLFQKS